MTIQFDLREEEEESTSLQRNPAQSNSSKPFASTSSSYKSLSPPSPSLDHVPIYSRE